MFKNLFKNREAMKRMKKRRKQITYLQPLKNTDIHMSYMDSVFGYPLFYIAQLRF